jgi:hypothetical protein
VEKHAQLEAVDPVGHADPAAQEQPMHAVMPVEVV